MLLWFVAVALILAPGPHPRSVSSARIEVHGAHIVLQVRTELRTLLESVPLDSDGDQRVSKTELEAGRSQTERYVLAHFRLQPSVTSWDAAASVLAGHQMRADLLDLDSGGFFGTRELVDLFFEFDCAAPPTSLAIESKLFGENDPWHRCQTDIVWEGAPAVGRVLWIEEPIWIFQPDSQSHTGVIGAYIRLGIEHILSGYDHIAFLIALIVASRRVKTLIGVVTAFTLAHSLTLAAAALGFVRVPSQPVEVTIAVSIAYVALRNLLSRKPRPLWPEAFGFGLVHGLGFAGAIGATLAAEPAKLQALFGFNFGVELGQLSIVATIVLILRLLPRGTEVVGGEYRTLAPRWLCIPASTVVAILGLLWVVERLG